MIQKRTASATALSIICLACVLALFTGSAVHAQQSGSVELNTDAPHALHTSPIAPNAPAPTFDITADQETGSLGSGSYSATGNVVILGGKEFEMRADSISVDSKTGVASAAGPVSIREIDTSLYADDFHLDRSEDLAIFDNALLDYPPIMLFANKIVIEPELQPNKHGAARPAPFKHYVLTAYNANLSTCPPGPHQEFHLYAKQVKIHVLEERIELINASLYLGHYRLATLRKYVYTASQPGGQQNPNHAMSPSAGYNGHQGVYAILGANVLSGNVPLSLGVLVPEKGLWSASAATSTTIGLGSSSVAKGEIDRETNPQSPIGVIRNFASWPGQPLPPGDPLLYHDFLNNNPVETVFNRPVVPDIVPNATLAWQQPLYGREITNLSYSRLPEAAVRLDLPLFGNGILPADRDPIAMRQALRKPYVYMVVNATQGYYQEQPTNAKSMRTALLVNFDARPILVASNTLLRPRLGLFEADYETVNSNYDYQQIDLALQHSYSERTAIGCEYISTNQQGHDPFVFDTVDTAQELDLRAQVGGSRFILGTRLKYDLIGQRVYDTEIVIGVPQHCYIPTVTLDFPSDTIGLGFNIPGLTY